MTKDFLVFIPADGKENRFKSEKPIILHPLLGKSVINLVIETATKLRPARIIVVAGSQFEDITRPLASSGVEGITQKNLPGTARALRSARKTLSEDREKDVLVLPANLPLLTPAILRRLLYFHRKQGYSLTLLSAQLEKAREKIKEGLPGVFAAKIKDLLAALPKVLPAQKRRDGFLAEVVEIMAKAGKKVAIFETPRIDELVQVRGRYDLARAAEVLRERKIRALTEKGVTVLDPRTTWIDLDVKIGPQSVIYPEVVIEGQARIGSYCRLYPFVHIINCRVGDRVRILSSTIIEESVIEDDVRVGPFTHLRPKTTLCAGSSVGNFVEMKNTVFGRKSKAGHLSYLGDSEVGEEVNIGAGTITCNYDGVMKNKTYIEAGAFIGSGTELIAPVRVGKRAYVGAGSTITKDVSPEALAIARSVQVERPGWARRKKRNKK